MNFIDDEAIDEDDERAQVEDSPRWRRLHGGRSRSPSPVREHGAPLQAPMPDAGAELPVFQGHRPEVPGDAAAAVGADDAKQLPGEEPPGELVDDGKFRLNNVRVFLTYSQCGDLTTAAVAAKLRFLGSTSFVVSFERHADGSPHIHAYAERHPPFNTTNSRYFDIGDKHPNVRRPKSRDACINYVCKSGTYEASSGFRIFSSPKNFSKNLADFNAWVDYGRSLAAPEPLWPIPLPDGTVLAEPAAANKRRSLLVVGPASCGKTTSFAHKWFGGRRIYAVPSGNHRFDAFNCERVIFYDDPEPWPTKGELIALCESAPYSRNLCARYNNRRIPPGWCGQVVICCNPESIPVDDGVLRTSYPWFTERFHCVYVDQNTVWP